MADIFPEATSGTAATIAGAIVAALGSLRWLVSQVRSNINDTMRIRSETLADNERLRAEVGALNERIETLAAENTRLTIENAVLRAAGGPRP